VVTEGEFKAIAIRKAGFNAIGVPGITNIRPKSNYSIICFDSDRKPEYVQRAILRLTKYQKDIKIATIPLAQNEDKMGADDYIEKYGVEAFKSVVNAALSVKQWKELML
jgi:DNA primase